MRRRDFFGVICGAAATWPAVARGQQQATPLVGYLGSDTPERYATRLASFRQGLNSMGFDEGRNVAIEYRWARGENGRLPALAQELVRANVQVIATPGTLASALAAKAATATIPIVFETGADPIASGLVASMNRPGGNITGVTSLNAQFGQKRLELLHELLPAADSFALLSNPTNQRNADVTIGLLQAAARALSLKLHLL
jgi:putative ABC transport system substrate-binding protein